mmetsp:Transcript_14865/g.38674  ORF Transcript_14865/g.38674 Transcript_14865/m.38674 type:complete len:245 (-) Transcript_14865:203-937(-)
MYLVWHRDIVTVWCRPCPSRRGRKRGEETSRMLHARMLWHVIMPMSLRPKRLVRQPLALQCVMKALPIPKWHNLVSRAVHYDSRAAHAPYLGVVLERIEGLEQQGGAHAMEDAQAGRKRRLEDNPGNLWSSRCNVNRRCAAERAAKDDNRTERHTALTREKVHSRVDRLVHPAFGRLTIRYRVAEILVREHVHAQLVRQLVDVGERDADVLRVTMRVEDSVPRSVLGVERAFIDCRDALVALRA